ncbi:alcohol dehydrogenase catalytic domain-containing protein [Halorussus halobius]|uniref:alcohol dehydrogenase catalytic domain-containing protein n=1 Tax=Halorussus halobius TaxID=1710537 RepID=UPI00109278B7|nr:alcohol dehydrogenase catalytic domain-containing protein [Halorussus halobius]
MADAADGETMTAIGFHDHGNPLDQLDVLDVPEPEVGRGDVLVDVKATALNHLDVFTVRELDHYVSEYPFWTGGDVAGVVAETGAGVTDWEVGDRVLVNPVLTCGECEYCRQGQEQLCPDLRTIGEHRRGGLAEYLSVPGTNLFSIPDDVDFTTASAVPIAGSTAWGALSSRAEVRPYEDVLIVGATGGVGTYAVQIAKNVFNVDTLIATTSTEEKADFLRDLGVDHVIDYTETEFDREVWELTDERGVDVCYNCVGGETWTKSMRSMAQGGRLVTSGATAGPNPETELRLVFIRGLDVLGSSVDRYQGFHELLEYVWDGTITPVVDDTFDLLDYEEAFRRVLDREMYGNVVLTQD